MSDDPGSDSARRPSARTDVCIVGSGPAGALLADKLAERGHDVVVLEAGKRFDREERHERMERSLRPAHRDQSVWDMDDVRDDFTSSGEVFYSLNDRRAKGVGGSTLHWGGRVARLRRKDFRMESQYGVATDWPIGYDDLRPYYAAAETEMGVAGAEDIPFSPPREHPYPMPPFAPSHSDSILGSAAERAGIVVHSVPNARNSEVYDGRSQCVGYGSCSPVCPSGAQYSADVHVDKAENKGARIIDQAMVQRLEHDNTGDRVRAAVYKTPDGTTYRQEAHHFVVACGGIETPRLLLLSASETYPDGLANSSGVLGEYLMETIYVGVAGQLDAETKQNQIGFGTTESYQFYEPDDVPPGSFKIEFSNNTGPTLAELALRQREPLRTLRRALSQPTNTSEYGNLKESTDPIKWGDELLGEIAEQYGNHFHIVSEIEVLPHRENRVTLDESKRDTIRNPVPDISWGYHEEYEEKTIERAYEVMERIVSHIDETVLKTERTMFRGGAGHPSGTTRMGTDPEESVVDPNLGTHDLENLSVVGSSTFPTRGASQPTLTIAALALRLGDQLDSVL
jgi:choline dehydrogenase-like flavoprotein